MDLELEKKLKGSRFQAVNHELLSNSFHFPLAIITIGILNEGVIAIGLTPITYLLILSTLFQSYFLGSRSYKRKSDQLLGNFITPAVYTVSGLLFEGMSFIKSPLVLLFWGIALLIGVLSEFFLYRSDLIARVALFIKMVARSGILMIVYLFTISDNQPLPAIKAGLLSQRPHLIVFMILAVSGVAFGVIGLYANSRLHLLWQSVALLKKYSEWLLGKGMMSMSQTDENTLSLAKKERTIVFVGINGFSAWSENKSPEVIVNLLNDYLQEAEQVWNRSNALKTRHTSDEIMAIFPGALNAVQSVYAVFDAVRGFLKPFNLSLRAGIHSGELAEGLIGSNDVRVYDVVGETVRVARRVYECSNEEELLISNTVYDQSKEYVVVESSRKIKVDVEDNGIDVYPVSDMSLLL